MFPLPTYKHRHTRVVVGEEGRAYENYTKDRRGGTGQLSYQ